MIRWYICLVWDDIGRICNIQKRVMHACVESVYN